LPFSWICYLQAGSNYCAKKIGKPGVRSVAPHAMDFSGRFDFMLKVVTENIHAYYDFHVKRLSGIENVGNVQGFL